jgi:hypothetical protein
MCLPFNFNSILVFTIKGLDSSSDIWRLLQRDGCEAASGKDAAGDHNRK